MGRKRSPERIQFLSNILVGAVKNGGYGGLRAQEWHCPEGRESEWYALMYEIEEPETVHRVDIDVIAKGVNVIAKSRMQPFVCPREGCPEGHRYCDNGEKLLHNAGGERLGLHPSYKKVIVASSFANDDENCEMDVIYYLAIMECGIYGRVVFG